MLKQTFPFCHMGSHIQFPSQQTLTHTQLYDTGFLQVGMPTHRQKKQGMLVAIQSFQCCRKEEIVKIQSSTRRQHPEQTLIKTKSNLITCVQKLLHWFCSYIDQYKLTFRQLMPQGNGQLSNFFLY